MEASLIVAAMTLAIELSGQERLVAADRPVTAAWVFGDLDAIADARPSGADGDGFVTGGELRDRRAERTGFMLVPPGSKARRIAWCNDFGH
jgi:hypothetical protein